MKPKTNGTQAFSLQNSEFARVVVYALRRALNKDKYKLIVRGRAKDRKAKGGTRETQPLETADWLAIYVEPRRPNRAWDEGYNVGLSAGIRSGRKITLSAVGAFLVSEERRVIEGGK